MLTMNSTAVLVSSPSLPVRQQTSARHAAHRIAVLAVRSLHGELVLYPKPGLVSLHDNGSHDDMTPETFLRSLFSLRHYFKAIALAGMQGADFQVLKHLGMCAELRMLGATKGINTHRGAIFALGMLCAAHGYCVQKGILVSAESLRATLLLKWGASLAQHSAVSYEQSCANLGQSLSHGVLVARDYGASGAREEAALGFPSVFELALPRLLQTLKEQRSWRLAQIDSLFSLMAHISDTNLYHRGGGQGAALVRCMAQSFLQRGGCAAMDWLSHAQVCHQRLIEQRLSPGGAADLLAATCFVFWSMQEPSAERSDIES